MPITSGLHQRGPSRRHGRVVEHVHDEEMQRERSGIDSEREAGPYPAHSARRLPETHHRGEAEVHGTLETWQLGPESPREADVVGIHRGDEFAVRGVQEMLARRADALASRPAEETESGIDDRQDPVRRAVARGVVADDEFRILRERGERAPDRTLDRGLRIPRGHVDRQPRHAPLRSRHQPRMQSAPYHILSAWLK